MIKEIQIKNLKCFKSIDITIAPLTILAGINSMGKSTVIESLLLLRESYLKRQNSISSGENRIPSFICVLVMAAMFFVILAIMISLV